MSIFVALMLVTGAAQGAPAATPEAAPPPKEKLICKRDESSSTRLGAGPKICKTAAQWLGKRAPAQGGGGDAAGRGQ
ncbi:MAG: hypothetical protein JOZ90_08215 [Alphaproteobacteria bacterium]|nr:hypothetical protein [Alphaproteobacteria bacterium]MBV9370171.1 hypothetical protein [Alphaproteobacteria bacterium]MBV9901068.1 hypothetical protein [Alphaproteobacteria bacterium]